MMPAYKNLALLLFWVISIACIKPKTSCSSLSIRGVSQTSPTVPLYNKLEVRFDINGTVAENLQWPYDPDNIPGLTTKTGISVDGLFWYST